MGHRREVLTCLVGERAEAGIVSSSLVLVGPVGLLVAEEDVDVRGVARGGGWN
jgi:hypothetical protein